mgnify:CR=1 FL=1
MSDLNDEDKSINKDKKEKKEEESIKDKLKNTEEKLGSKMDFKGSVLALFKLAHMKSNNAQLKTNKTQ